MCKFNPNLWCVLVLYAVLSCFSKCSGYLVIITNSNQPGTVIFEAGFSGAGSGHREYSLNPHRNGYFVQKLFYVDPSSGSVILVKHIDCSSIEYPSLFTLYVDSTSNTTLEYLSVPLRILVKDCDDKSEFNDADARAFIKLSEAKEWFSETLASFVIPGSSFEPGLLASPPAEICLKQSQLLTNVGSALIPASISQRCRIKYIDVSDQRFKFEESIGDLVAAQDVCIPAEPSWDVRLLFQYTCDGIFDIVSPSEHHIKIVFWYRRDFNDTNRVRRDTRQPGPQFERALYVASISEEQPPGLSVCSVVARDVEGSSSTYSMVSLLDARTQSLFSIDTKSGLVSTAATLDREVLDVHYFRVIATDSAFPPRSSTTTLQINVLDANDHAPVFEAPNAEYEASIRESIPIGSSVVTVRATDKDIGHNAEIEYSIQSINSGGLVASEPGSEPFSLDGKSGVLITRLTLDRETTEVFTIIVIATDQALPASDRKSSTATVVVHVLDDNDNYPQFLEKAYSVSVDEDTNFAQSPVIATIKAIDIDEGQNAAIRYAIIGGNTQGQFSIDSQSGEVTLVKSLDYEALRNYRLIIRAQDGGSPSRSNTTSLLINVKDVNDNAPRFYTTLFQETVSEAVPVGYSIVQVQAYDADEGDNSLIKYSLSPRDLAGSPANELPISIDETSGWIVTSKELDREVNNKFQFQVLATDHGSPQKTATASVVFLVQDVNDNDPTFNPKQYEAVVGEDDPPGTPVTSVSATDPDENPRLHYELSGGNTRSRFMITTQNGRGLITIAQPLDYKQEKRFIITVKATDSDGRFDTATVYVNVSDANNFAPTFDNPPYSASVYEDAPVGSTVLVVTATDNDVGQNALITYSLAAGNAPEFTINSQTGAIITTKPLDRETTGGYLLTVTAKDGGVPPQSDTTDVEITVSDVNDNKPLFSKPAYTGSVSEDALVGTSVIHVIATDVDFGLNGRIRYALGNDTEAFVIDPASGVIRTAKPLDRESVAQYEIEALAIDRGTPPLTGTAMVTVKIEDVNDSPPAFESDKLTLYIPENSPISSTVGEIYAKDPDEGPNAVVQYSVIGGEDSNSFSLVRRPGSDKADLLTMVDLDYESAKKRYELIIRAASPPLRSDVHVEIIVTDVNDNAPRLKDFLIIFNNFRDCFPSGVFGKIPAFDADISDKLTFRIISGNNANLVNLNESTGHLSLSPQLNTNVPKVANMEVSVSDGINEVKASMQLMVRLVTDEMLFSSITVRLADMTEEAFLSPLFNFFVEGLAAIIPCPKENVFIFSIQGDTDVSSKILNVSFSAKKADGSFYTPQFLQERVYLNRAVLTRLATVQVLPFDDNLCVREPCLNYEECLTVLKFGNASGFISSDSVLFRPIYPVSTFSCHCPKGFTGSREHYLCDTEVNLCYSDPCLNGGECKRKESGYSCICLPGFAGDNCEIDLSKDTCKPNVCQSDSSCTPLPQGGFSCNNCASGTTFEYHNNLCQLRGRSFPKHSFLTFPSLKQRHRLYLKLKFATLESSGLLLYNGRYNEKHDFIALELIDNARSLQFSFSLGSSTTRVIATSPTELNDGNWHTVTVEYVNKSAVLSIDDCDVALSIKHGSQLGLHCANISTQVLEDRCALFTETCYRFLDLTGPLQIGGLPSLPSSTSFQVQYTDFVGCISDVFIDHKLLDLNTYVADNGTLIGCAERKSFCSSQPCQNGGTCFDDWGSYKCECAEGWSGKDCSQNIEPAWRFKGNGVLSFNPLLRLIQLPWLIGMSVRTLQSDAFLISIQVGQNSSATISLESGYIVFAFDGQTAALGTARINDGAWHRVEIMWQSGGQVRIALDYGKRHTVKTINAKIQGMYVGKIIIGGYEDEQNSVTKPPAFNGCVQDVRVGSSQKIAQQATMKINVEDGCYEGDECTVNSNRCPVHSECESDWEQYSCKCHSGYIGTSCTNVCELNPCSNGAACVSADKPRGYSCLCASSKYSGEYCDDKIDETCPVSWWGHPVCGPCNCPVDKGYNPDCNKTNGECYCKENHYQPDGSDQCLDCNCYSVGSFGLDCNTQTGQCHCRAGVIGRRCDACPNAYAEVTLRGCEVVYDGCPRNFAGGLWWPRTKFGDVSVENCPSGSHGTTTRSCDDFLGGWQNPDLFNCTSTAFLHVKSVLSQLERNELSITTFVAIETSNTLRRAANETPSLYGSDVLLGKLMIEKLLAYETSLSGLNLTHSQDKDYIENILIALSRFVNTDVTDQWIKLEEKKQNLGMIIKALLNYLINLAKNQKDTYTDPFEIVTPNVALGLDVVSSESLYGYETEGTFIDNDIQLLAKQSERGVLPNTPLVLQPQFASLKSGSNNILGLTNSHFMPTVIFPKYNNYLQNKEKFDPHSQIMIPMDLLGIKDPSQVELTQHDFLRDRQAVVGYAQYKTVGHLLSKRYDETVVKRWGVDLLIGSPVVSVVVIANDPDTDEIVTLNNKVPLTAPVRLRLWLNEPMVSSRSNPQCVRWTADNEWTRAGCHTELPESNWWRSSEPILINCTCNQLSTHALLVDMIDPEFVLETSPLEDAVTWLGFALTIIALTFSSMVLSLLKARTNSSSIFTNQAFCLLITQTIFLLLLKGRAEMVANEILCKLSAISLHYSWLCVFSWSLVGSLHLYRMLTEMRDVNHGQMGFYYSLGYCLPAIVVALAVGVRIDQYGNYFFCWLSLYESVVWSLIGPVCLVISINIIVLLLSLRAAFTLKDHIAGYGNLRTVLWLSVVHLPLLTIVWILELFSASEREPIFCYLLALASAVQSWFMLCGFCFGNSRIRMGLHHAVFRMLGKKVPPMPTINDSVDVVHAPVSPSLNPGRSSLAYHNTGVNSFEPARRNFGISISSTTSRSTTKTNSSPYRSDAQLRQTSTSTSNYDQSASDVPSHFQRRKTQHTSDSDSEASDGRSLDLASSHSSDDEETSTNRSQKRTVSASPLPPNIKGDSKRLTSVEPPQHLNVITNSQLFPNLKPVYPSRWASHLTDTYNAVEEEQEPSHAHRWQGMLGSTITDNEANIVTTARMTYEPKLINSDSILGHTQDIYDEEYKKAELGHRLYYDQDVTPGSDVEENKSTLGDKYSFPYTAEEDHCRGSPNFVSDLQNSYSNSATLLHNREFTESPYSHHSAEASYIPSSGARASPYQNLDRAQYSHLESHPRHVQMQHRSEHPIEDISESEEEERYQ
nr:PREDICTED: protocadherin-like wing polarity protein stan isoform X2 [Bemisia tabaci]